MLQGRKKKKRREKSKQIDNIKVNNKNEWRQSKPEVWYKESQLISRDTSSKILFITRLYIFKNTFDKQIFNYLLKAIQSTYNSENVFNNLKKIQDKYEEFLFF